MEFKNYRSLSVEGLEEYTKELESEFERLKEEITKLCDEVKDIDEEYTLVKEELTKRGIE